jgi:hypothetical protein
MIAEGLKLISFFPLMLRVIRFVVSLPIFSLEKLDTSSANTQIGKQYSYRSKVLPSKFLPDENTFSVEVRTA